MGLRYLYGKRALLLAANLMYQWVNKKIRKLNKMKLKEYEIIKRGKTFGLKIDKTHVDTPNEPIFLN